MAERLTVVDSAGRAKAFRPLPVGARAAALRDGLAAYERGDFFEAHELLEPAWMGTDDPGERAFLQGLIKLAAAYVHDVRGNPAGIVKNLTGARAWLLEASIADYSARRRRPGGPRRPGRSPARGSCGPPDRTLARATGPAQERGMTLPGTIPTVDVTEAERRLRDDPERPVLLDVREPDEFETVRAPGALHIPMSTFQARVGDVPTDRPVMVICRTGGRSAAVTGFLVRSGRTDVVNVAGGMDAWATAGFPTRSGTPEPGEGQLSG